MKIHILEGTDTGGRKHTACGRLLAATTQTIGRAHILTGRGTSEVTCKRCRQKYAHYFDGPNQR
jgi:hypothetical protein